MAVVRRAPYKDFLQPALHRRFSTCASILLGIAFVESVVFASWKSLFWAIFPIGPTGIRAFFIFLCGLVVIVLRIAQYHVGVRTSNSGLQTFMQYALTSQTLEAVVSYTVSSWLFSQIYLWTAPAEDLAWISIQMGDRARLNEKPVFLTAHFILFGLVQGMLHIIRDDDRLLLSSVRLGGGTTTANEKPPSWPTRLMNEVPALANLAAMQSAAVLAVNVVLYHCFFRGIAWRAALAFFRTFYTLPKTNMVPATLAGVKFSVLARCFYTGSMLLFLWLVGNKMFSLFLVRPPLKNGNPLTSESKDPNGSLLNGLKSKKLPIKCFAMWELALIARDFESRRKAIYHDIDRKDGPTWSQIYSLCLDVIKGIEARIDDYGKKPEPVSTAVVPATADAKSAPPAAKPISKENVLLATPTKKNFHGEVEKVVGKMAVSPGQVSRLSPIVEKGLAQARGAVDEIARQATDPTNPNNQFQYWLRRVLDSPLGLAFKQTWDRRIATAVFGRPYGEPSLYINAVSALTRLAVSSLAEDSYGNVQRDVSTIIRTFTGVTTKLDKFKAEFPVHWTDLGGQRECQDVNAILETLKQGLQELINNFGPFHRELRLTFADMRHAREAAGMPARDVARIEFARPEMRQQR